VCLPQVIKSFQNYRGVATTCSSNPCNNGILQSMSRSSQIFLPFRSADISLHEFLVSLMHSVRLIVVNLATVTTPT
jgi:hypothetical protein